MKAILLATMIAYTGGNLYLFVRSLQQMSGMPVWAKVMFGAIFWVVAFALFVALGARNVDMPEVVARTMFRVGSAWMVFLLYMVLSLVVVDLLRLALPHFNGFYYALGFTLCLLAYGYWNYRHPDIVELDIKLEKPLEKPLRVVAVSDIHLGYGTDKKSLQRYVKMINEQQPDLILIGGDLIDNSLKPVREQRMEEELNELKAPLGIYMVMGNHEYISGAEECEEFLGRTSVKLLRDSIATLPCGVQIVGRDDRSNRNRKTLEELIAECDNEKPIIVMDHQPYQLMEADKAGIDMQFSGHTHRGQVFPLNVLTDKMYEQSHGYRHWSHAHIIVSSGLALWGPPFRIGTKSELVVININGK